MFDGWLIDFNGFLMVDVDGFMMTNIDGFGCSMLFLDGFDMFFFFFDVFSCFKRNRDDQWNMFCAHFFTCFNGVMSYKYNIWMHCTSWMTKL